MIAFNIHGSGNGAGGSYHDLLAQRIARLSDSQLDALISKVLAPDPKDEVLPPGFVKRVIHAAIEQGVFAPKDKN